MAKKDTNTPKKEVTPGYEIKVTGEYVSLNANTGLKSAKHYPAEVFYLPEVVTYAEGVKREEWEEDGQAKHKIVPNLKKANSSRVGLHIIRKYYIPYVLKEKYADYHGVRTCEVFSCIRVDISGKASVTDITKKNIQDMSWSELSQYIMLENINIILGTYSNLGEAKNAVVRAAKQKKADEIAAGTAPAPTLDEIALTPSDSTGIQETGALDSALESLI